MKQRYILMHEELEVAHISETGVCKILNAEFMPYNLFLEEGIDLDTLVSNVVNFYYWCSTRLLTLDRQYAKEIFNSMGVPQPVTDKDRAQIALMCRCLSLTDVYWVKQDTEFDIHFKDVNLYANHLSNVFIDIALCGKQYSVQNNSLACDISTAGCFPKAWRRETDGFYLLKGGGEQAVLREIQASKICDCFNCSHVSYTKGVFDGEPVSVSKAITDTQHSIVSIEMFEVYAANHEIDAEQHILSTYSYDYHMMNIIDYLVGNTDRHRGNWGFLIDNISNKPIALHKLMDFNRSFTSYDTIEGANSLTSFKQGVTQKEAALHAVSVIGLNQIRDIDAGDFSLMPDMYDMFKQRLNILRR